jgi:hypothetical protein
VKPVRFRLGRAKLVTKPLRTGSPVCKKTMGVVRDSACRAAIAACFPPPGRSGSRARTGQLLGMRAHAGRIAGSPTIREHCGPLPPSRLEAVPEGGEARRRRGTTMIRATWSVSPRKFLREIFETSLAVVREIF